MESSFPTQITLPVSKARIQFTKDFDRDRLADLTRKMLVDDELTARMRTNPIGEMAKLGVVIDERDVSKITDEDVLVAMGHRGSAALAGPQAVVVVIIAVFNFPQPVY